MSGKTLIAFDYAIKYLLKDKGDYEIVEGFISSLLESAGYGPVKIMLESESNREESSLKKSIADVVVEDIDGNKYLVEIERQFTSTFMHKTCFNSSRLIVDSVNAAADFSTIKKVFHISLLYFVWNKMETPVYHAKTVVKEIGSNMPLDLEFFDAQGKKFEVHNVFPEYFFICVPLFNNVIRRELDEWLYVMKNSQTKDDFKSPYMKKLEERLNMLKMNQEERYAYIKYEKEACSQRDAFEAAEEKGIAKGELKKAQAIAIQMLTAGMDVKVVAKLTGLSIEEIGKLS